MSEVVKAGVLEVTVVQAVGLDLLGSSSALARTRRKPVVHARVTVDGHTKTGHPAPRSHHPVWYPRYPSHNLVENSSARSSKTYSRGGGDGDDNFHGNRIGVPSRPGSLTRNNDLALMDRTRSSRRGMAVGGVDGFGDSSASMGGILDGSVGRGMLFDVREFYGPTRIVVELVSGSGSSSSNGVSGGNGVVVTGSISGGGTVIGKCEARLAEALVRRGGGGYQGGSSVSSPAGFTKTGYGLAPRTPAPTSTPFSPIPEAQTPAFQVETFASSGSSGGDSSATRQRQQQPSQQPQLLPPPLVAPSLSPPDDRVSALASDGFESPRSSSRHDRVGQGAVVPAPTSTAAATTDTALASGQCSSMCLPKPCVFLSWRRHHGGGRRTSSGSNGSSGSTGTGEDGVSSVVPETGSGGVAGRGSDKASGSGGSRGPSWRAARSPRKDSLCSSSAGGGAGVSASKTVAKDLSRQQPSTAMTLEEAESLAVTSWGGIMGGVDSAKDMWKELVSVGGGGRAAGGEGVVSGGVVGAGGPAVRLRLRFVPLWDCLADGGGPDGLGALHAAARDGDARLLTSLVHLWHSLSPGSQILALPCRRGLTPIQHCIEAGKEAALRELLRGIGRDSLRLSGKEGEDTALHTAIKAREEGMLRILLAIRRTEMPPRMFGALRFGLGAQSNTMVSMPGGDGLTPLALAAMCGTEGMVRCLLEEGADAAAVDARGMTPLAHAAQSGNLPAVRALFKAKVAVNGSSGNVIRRSRLARMGCAPCKNNEDGMGPVALAAASGSAQVVSELIRAEVPYRTRDRGGRTPLHHAARYGHTSVLRVLVAEMRKGKASRSRGLADGEAGSSGLPGEVNTMMMDGGPFKLSNLDLSGRTAHATALMHEHLQAAAFLEAAEEELEPRQPKHKETQSSKRKPWGGTSTSIPVGGRTGHQPRFSLASPTTRSGQGSGSSGSGQGSGTSGRPSPLSSNGMGSMASAADSEDLSYEYIESDREE